MELKSLANDLASVMRATAPTAVFPFTKLSMAPNFPETITQSGLILLLLFYFEALSHVVPLIAVYLPLSIHRHAYKFIPHCPLGSNC